MSLVVEAASGGYRGVHVRVSDDLPLVRVYRGIPFAAPPLGVDRFGPPQPVERRDGVWGAIDFGTAPMQIHGAPFGSVIPASEVGAVSEDSLTLNVWTPDGDPADRPVMVWLYGGAFLGGTTSNATFDAARLAAEHGVVVVSANYRVGVFGFLWLDPLASEGDGVAANPGLLDQLAALRWVRENVVAFGGDPDLVTVFGESAGAGSILHLMSMPQSAGLFRRAICQSPGVDHTVDAGRAEVVTATFLDGAGIPWDDHAVQALRELSAPLLLAAQAKCLPSLMHAVSSMPFHPVVDGIALPSKPSAVAASGAGAAVDLLLTWTANEMRLFPNYRADELGRDGVVRWAARYLTSRLGSEVPADRAGDLVDYYIERYAGAGDHTMAYAWADLQTDGIMRLPARRIAELRSAAPGRTYCAEFRWAAADAEDGWQRGAFHAVDLPFVFGTLDRCDWRSFLGAEAEADQLSAEMRAAWAAFAREGVPASPALGAWPRYAAPTRSTVVLDGTCSVVDDPLGELDERWDGLWSLDGGPPPGVG